MRLCHRLWFNCDARQWWSCFVKTILHKTLYEGYGWFIIRMYARRPSWSIAAISTRQSHGCSQQRPRSSFRLRLVATRLLIANFARCVLSTNNSQTRKKPLPPIVLVNSPKKFPANLELPTSSCVRFFRHPNLKRNALRDVQQMHARIWGKGDIKLRKYLAKIWIRRPNLPPNFYFRFKILFCLRQKSWFCIRSISDLKARFQFWNHRNWSLSKHAYFKFFVKSYKFNFLDEM